MQKNIIIIGGGPAGYVGAIRGSQLGANVTLIEKQDIGGTCLNRGCIPTKALFKNSEILNTLKKIDDFGITIDNYDIDFKKIMQRKDTIVTQLVKGVEKLLKDYKINVISGDATFINSNTLSVKTNNETIELSADYIVIATGSIPSKPHITGYDLPNVITSDELLELEILPKSLAIAGSGVIGLEFASIFNSLGSEVTVISSTLLKRVDGEIQKRLPSILKRQGLNIIKNSRVKEIKQKNDLLLITAKDKKDSSKEYSIEAEYLLFATGRKANFDTLNLDTAGVTYSQRGILVNKSFETNIKGVFAVGDVIGGLMLAHVASHEAIDAVEYIMGNASNTNYDVVPDCVFIHPEVSSVGLTEELAKEKSIEYTTSKFLFAANGKSLSMGNTDGFIKVIAEKTSNKIIGVHIMGPHASDLIHEATLAINHNMNVDAIAHTIHAHPTLSEAFSESVNGIVNMAIHMAPKKK